MSQTHRKVIYSDILRYGLPVFKVSQLKEGDQEYNHIIPYSIVMNGNTLNISLTNNTLEWIRKVELNNTNSLIPSMSGINPYFSNGPNLNDSSSVKFNNEYHVCRLKLPPGNYSTINEVIAKANQTLKAEINKLFTSTQTMNNIIGYSGITRYLQFTSDLSISDQVFKLGSFNIQKPVAVEDEDERVYVDNFINYLNAWSTPSDYQGYDSVNDEKVNESRLRIMRWPASTTVDFINSDSSTETISIYEAIYRMSVLYQNPNVNQDQIDANLSLASWPSDLKKNYQTYNVSGPLYKFTNSMKVNGYPFDHDLLLKLPVQAKTAETNVKQRIEDMMNNKPEFMYSLYNKMIDDGVDDSELVETITDDEKVSWQVLGCLRTYLTQLNQYLEVQNSNLFINDEPTVALYNDVSGLEATITNITSCTAYDFVFMKINRLMEMAGIEASYSIDNFSEKVEEIISNVQLALKNIYNVQNIDLDSASVQDSFTTYDQRLREAIQIQQMLNGLIPPIPGMNKLSKVMTCWGLTWRTDTLYTKVLTVPSIDPEQDYSDEYVKTIEKLIDIQIYLEKVYYDDQGVIHTTNSTMTPGDNLDELYHSTYFLYNTMITYYDIINHDIPTIIVNGKELSGIDTIKYWMKSGSIYWPEGLESTLTYNVTEFIKTIKDSIIDNGFFPDSDHFNFNLLIDNEEEALLANYIAQKYIVEGLDIIKVTTYYPIYESSNGSFLECDPSTLGKMFSAIYKDNEVSGYNTGDSLTYVEVKASKFPNESRVILNELNISNQSSLTYQIETGSILDGKVISFHYDEVQYTLKGDENAALMLFATNKYSTVQKTSITEDLYQSIIDQTDPFQDPTYIDKQEQELVIAKNYLLLNDRYITSIRDNETVISLDEDENMVFLNNIIPVQTREYAPNLPLYDQKQRLLNADESVYIRDIISYNGSDSENFNGSFSNSTDQFIIQLYNSSDNLVPSDMYIHRNNENGLWSRLGYRAHYIDPSALRYLIKTTNYSEQILDSSISINGRIITSVNMKERPSGKIMVSASEQMVLPHGFSVKYNESTLIENMLDLKVQHLAQMSLLIPSEISLYSSTSSDVEELVNNLSEDSFMEGIYSFTPTPGQMVIPITTSRILNIPKGQDLYLYLTSIEQPYVLENGKYKLIIDYL